MAQDGFATAAAFVLAQEGGFVDHPADPGGPTRFGITRAALAQARGGAVTAEDVKALGSDEARAIYRLEYWAAIRGDDLPPGLDLAVFDLAVNSGPGRAVRLLQAAVAVEADGILGPATLRAAWADPAGAIRRLAELRLAFLARLPGWPVFGRGWRRRVLACERLALQRAGAPDFPQHRSFP
jgi:lysozyme family protein